MINIKYVSASMDSSGYAAAARDYIWALHHTGRVNLTTEVVSFETQKTTHGKTGHLVKSLMDKKVDPTIQIVHLTPENFPKFRNPKLYTIGYCAWETDKLPPQWPIFCNMMDEVWVPSDYNVECFRNSGVTKPILKVKHCIEEPDTTGITPLEIGNPNDYVFYFIGQWIERKGIIPLLKAYLTEFSPNEPVNLAVKSYRLDSSQREQDLIKQHVVAIKKAINLEKYPPITFFGNLFPYEYIQGLHMRGDCFVYPVRSEGFGICPATALMHEKPVIATNYSGHLEYLNSRNSFLIGYQPTPVYGMIFGNYDGSMTWADPNIMDLRKQMRYCYENREEAKKKAMQGKKDILEQLNYTVIGNLMADRLEKIQSELK